MKLIRKDSLRSHKTKIWCVETTDNSEVIARKQFTLYDLKIAELEKLLLSEFKKK